MTKHKRRKQTRRACPLCAEPRPNFGLPIAIPFGVPTYWSPDAQGCSTLWNGQDFKQVIDARQSGAVAVLREGAGLA
jgi:hypothetical protein